MSLSSSDSDDFSLLSAKTADAVIGGGNNRHRHAIGSDVKRATLDTAELEELNLHSTKLRRSMTDTDIGLSSSRSRRYRRTVPQRGRKADWLKVGAQVQIAVGQYGGRRGMVMYVGELEFARGEWVGISLDQPVGKHDGQVKGKRYFRCPQQHGIFFKPSMLLPVERGSLNRSSRYRRSRSASNDYGGLYRRRKTLLAKRAKSKTLASVLSLLASASNNEAERKRMSAIASGGSGTMRIKSVDPESSSGVMFGVAEIMDGTGGFTDEDEPSYHEQDGDRSAEPGDHHDHGPIHDGNADMYDDEYELQIADTPKRVSRRLSTGDIADLGASGGEYADYTADYQGPARDHSDSYDYDDNFTSTEHSGNDDDITFEEYIAYVTAQKNVILGRQLAAAAANDNTATANAASSAGAGAGAGAGSGAGAGAGAVAEYDPNDDQHDAFLGADGVMDDDQFYAPEIMDTIVEEDEPPLSRSATLTRDGEELMYDTGPLIADTALPPYTLHIKVVEGKNLPAADPNGFSDPFVRASLKLSSKKKAVAKAKTRTINKTLDPVWNEDFSFSAEMLDGHVVFKVYDHDTLFRNDFLGMFQISLKKLHNTNNVQGWFALLDKSLKRKTRGAVYAIIALDTDCTALERKDKTMALQRRREALHDAAERHLRFLAEQGKSRRTVDRYSLVRAPLSSYRSQRIDTLVATWNVGNAPPPDDLRAWLVPKIAAEQFDTDSKAPSHIKIKPHVIAVGVQECKYEPRAPFDTCEQDWVHTIMNAIGDSYVLVEVNRLMEMRLHVFVHRSMVRHITSVDKHREATGIGGVVGNKGGVAISITLNDTSICFVNSHLAAHQDKTFKRNADVAEIIEGVSMGRFAVDMLNQFHHVVWLGDLNYRLDYGQQNNAHTPSSVQFAEMKSLIERKQLDGLLACDQLAAQMQARNVFLDFVEGPITFAPTFKVVRDKLLEYNPQRSPAWCDRVLRRSMLGYPAMTLDYKAVPEILSSDHKPVVSMISLEAVEYPSGMDDKYESCKIEFTDLRASNLPAADLDGSSDPYVEFHAPFLAKVYKTKHKEDTLNPVWSQKDIPVLSLTLTSKKRLRLQFLIVKVYDRDYASADDLLACGVIPLYEFISDTDEEIAAAAKPFTCQLTRGGVPRGKLEGLIDISWILAQTTGAAVRAAE
jgi:Endonuclease/Exonuclease/phosphatase family 2/C2 domain/CAP-Gly domain